MSVNQCSVCLATTTSVKKCGGCHVTFYCSRECQKRDWSTHKSLCRQVSSENNESDESDESENNDGDGFTIDKLFEQLKTDPHKKFIQHLRFDGDVITFLPIDPVWSNCAAYRMKKSNGSWIGGVRITKLDNGLVKFETFTIDDGFLKHNHISEHNENGVVLSCTMNYFKSGIMTLKTPSELSNVLQYLNRILSDIDSINWDVKV